MSHTICSMDFSARSSTATVRTVQRFLYLFLVCISLIFPSQAAGYSQGIAASVVIGQPSFTTGVANQGGSPTANTIKAPVGVHYDPSSKKLFVADSENNRVLIYNSIPTANNAAADVVVGQQNFSSSSINQGGSPTANSLSYPNKHFCGQRSHDYCR